MNKRIKQLLKSLKELYSSQVIKNIALKTKFMKRESKLTPEIFLSLCLFDGDDLCRSSLLKLANSENRVSRIRSSGEQFFTRYKYCLK